MLKFFLNTSTTSYLRDLEAEFEESTNGIRIELKRFETAGLLQSHFEGNKRIYKANTSHPLFSDIHNLLLKYTGIDQVVNRVLSQLNGLQQAWLVGDFARGRYGQTIDLLLVGGRIDVEALQQRVKAAEELIGRNIRYHIFERTPIRNTQMQFRERLLLFEG
ncbi:MAG: ArsR family transcriptional regulator [Lentimicrobiaceae bacterium]|nr:ArsR family transcriptional regulator [Lentimicrobiaceae bacterium]